MSGENGSTYLTELVLYDGTIVVAGFLLFPSIWTP
jgi:hypothetical protein